MFIRAAVIGCLAQQVVPVQLYFFFFYKRAAVISWLVKVGPAVISWLAQVVPACFTF
jgi:hypothetical protein